MKTAGHCTNTAQHAAHSWEVPQGAWWATVTCDGSAGHWQVVTTTETLGGVTARGTRNVWVPDSDIGDAPTGHDAEEDK